MPPLASVVVLELRAGAPVVTITGGAISLAPKGGLSFEIAPGRTVILAAAVSGADGDRGLALVGGGALVLARPCDYRGGTTVTEATLTLGDGGILPPKGRLTLVSGRLELGPQDAEIGALAGDGGTITLGAKTLTVDQDSDSEFQGAIDGSGRFVKAGARTARAQVGHRLDRGNHGQRRRARARRERAGGTNPRPHHVAGRRTHHSRRAPRHRPGTGTGTIMRTVSGPPLTVFAADAARLFCIGRSGEVHRQVIRPREIQLTSSPSIVLLVQISQLAARGGRGALDRGAQGSDPAEGGNRWH